MSELPLEDVTQVFHIVAECRELGDDSLRWRGHLLTQAVALLGARVGLSGEVPIIRWNDFARPPQVQHGWDTEDESRRCLAMFERDQASNPLFVRAAEALGPVATFTRQAFVSDDEWYALPAIQNVMRPANIDGTIQSGRLCGDLPGWADGLVVFFAWGGRQPTEHDRQLLELLHNEIAPLVGGPLAARGEPAPSDLPPRKRQVLECLLLGATDKQIAKSLKISRPTVSEYVGEVLRHFDVKSRAELVAAFLARHRPPQAL